MNSIKDKTNDKRFGEISRGLIKNIYSSLKKRKLYQRFKLSYTPFTAIREDEERRIVFDGYGSFIYIPVNENPHDCIRYSPRRPKQDFYYKSKFFKMITIALIMLKHSFLTKKSTAIDPIAITQYISQDYFEEYAKNNKTPKNELFYSFIVGNIFMVLGVIILLFLLGLFTGKVAIGITLILLFCLILSLTIILSC
jgi:ABC-type multidrug transport system fused ATPase/permease subunit